MHVRIFNSLLRLPSGPVPLDFPPNVCVHYLFHACLVPGPYHSLWFRQPRTSGGRKTPHTYPQPRPNWVEATYKPMTWNSPALSPAREISTVCHEHDGLRARKGVGFTTNKSHRWLTLKWNTNLLRIFEANAGSLQSQRSNHGSMVLVTLCGLCVCSLCLEYRPHYRIARPEFNFWCQIQEFGSQKAKSLFYIKEMSQMCETKNQYACNFQRTECIFDDLLLLSSLSYALSHSITIMVNYIIRIVKGSGRG